MFNGQNSSLTSRLSSLQNLIDFYPIESLPKEFKNLFIEIKQKKMGFPISLSRSRTQERDDVPRCRLLRVSSPPRTTIHPHGPTRVTTSRSKGNSILYFDYLTLLSIQMHGALPFQKPIASYCCLLDLLAVALNYFPTT